MTFITIDPQSDAPLFQQIHDQIINGILTGRLAENQRLDSVRRVAAEFGINPATVQKVYDLLKDDGIIRTEKRSGSVVQTPSAINDLQLDALKHNLDRILSLSVVQGITEDQLRTVFDDILTKLFPQPAPTTRKSHLQKGDERQ